MWWLLWTRFCVRNEPPLPGTATSAVTTLEIQMGKWFPSSVKQSSNFSVPELPGCYALFFAGELVYVGMSNCLRNRLKSHNLRNVPGPNMFDGWMETPWGNLPWHQGHLSGKLRITSNADDALRIEQKLINRLNPRFNKQGRTDGGW